MLGVLIVIIVVFGFSLLVGAPFVPTHKASVEPAMRLLALDKRDLLLELGAGDGRLAMAAANRGAAVLAIEINPFLFWLLKWRSRSQARIQVVFGDFRRLKWPRETTAVYVFADGKTMDWLAKALKNVKRPIRIVSHGFSLPGHEPTKIDGALLRYDIKPVA
ncbi:MAG TPA: methyltransferase domain-containing protein [Candidatus Saccharimonadales bacterium]